MNERVDPATLSQEIDETRADVGETLDALQAKLSPRRLIDEAVTYAGEQGYEIARRLGQLVKDHPVPVALAGAGLLAVLAVRRSRDGADLYSEGYVLAEDYDPSLEEGAEGSGLRAAGSSARERASRASGAVRRRARRAGSGFARVLNEQPLLVGAVGAAIGAAIAAMLPPSDTEDELLGGMSDRAFDRAKEKGGEQYEKVRDTVRRAAEGARRAVSESEGGSSSAQV